MATEKPQVKAYIDKLDYLKFKKINEKENRGISNALGYLIKKYIQEYEKINGEITIDKE